MVWFTHLEHRCGVFQTPLKANLLVIHCRSPSNLRLINTTGIHVAADKPITMQKTSYPGELNLPLASHSNFGVRPAPDCHMLVWLLGILNSLSVLWHQFVSLSYKSNWTYHKSLNKKARASIFLPMFLRKCLFKTGVKSRLAFIFWPPLLQDNLDTLPLRGANTGCWRKQFVWQTCCFENRQNSGSHA